MMAKMEVKWRVVWMESERGWGQKTFTTDYDTEAKAKKAIAENARQNQEDWDKTKQVPDYYIQHHKGPYLVPAGH